MNTQSIKILPMPSREIEREVGIADDGSPQSMNRGTSTSSTESIEQSMKSHLERYKIFLEHEVEFIQKEVEALKPLQEKPFQELRDGLKVRLTSLETRLQKTVELLNLM